MPSPELMDECNSTRQVAEIVHLRGCFSFRARRPPVVEILTAAAAALRVSQGGVTAVLWLDVVTEELFLTQRFGVEAKQQQLPLRLAVTAITPPVHSCDEELTVASIAFTDRQSLELFVRLGQHVLPQWLSIREGALGTNLFCSQGHWLLRYHDEGVLLQSPACGLTGLVQLNLHKACIELLMQQEQGTVRLEVVGSLQAAAKALQKHSSSKQQACRTVMHSIQHLQPTERSVDQLQAHLRASSEKAKGASSMRSWINSGIIAALVDCAATLELKSRKQLSQKLSEDHHDDLGSGSLCGRATAVLQGLADCVALVLGCSAEQHEQQAQLLVDCVARSLCGSGITQAVMVTALLKMVLQAFSDNKYQCGTSSGSLWDPLWKACQSPLLWQHMLWCYSQATPTHVQQPAAALHSSDACQQADQALEEQQPRNQVIELFDRRSSGNPVSGPSSYPLDLFSNGDDYDGVTSPGKIAAAERSQPSSDPGSSLKRPLVPRLSLPLLGQSTPTVAARSSRLSRRASDANSAATPDVLHPDTVSSALAVLQQLGQNCGESLMASDLAAFVTLKQLHSGQAAVVQHGRRMLSHSSAGDGGPSPDTCQPHQEPAQLTWHQLEQLPQPLQLQLHLLDCFNILTSQPAASDLPASAENALLEQLLLPRSLVLHRLRACNVQQASLLEQALDQQRHMGLQVVVRSHELKNARRHSLSSQADDTLDTLPKLHDSVLAQINQRLLDYCLVKRPDASVHMASTETLLLLRDYLHQASRPKLIDTVCSVVGGALGQHEYMLRSSRVSLWSWAAAQHMDALVQVYTELSQQATGTLAVNFLLQTLGSQPPPSISSGGGVSGCGSAIVSGSIPADTLLLVLEYMQQRLPACNTPAQWSAKQSGRICSAQVTQEVGSPVASSSGHCRHLNINAATALDKQSVLSPMARLNSNRATSLAGISECSPTCSERSTAGADFGAEQEEAKHASTYKRHCWELLTAIVELETRQTPSGVNKSSWGGSSSPARSSSLGSDAFQYSKSAGDRNQSASTTMESSKRAAAAAAVPEVLGSDKSGGDLDQHWHQPPSLVKVQLPPTLIGSSEAGTQIGQSQLTAPLSPGQGPPGSHTPCTAPDSSRSGQPVHRPVPLLLSKSASRTSQAGSTAGAVSSGGSGPSGEVMRVLVDLLLRQRGGRTYVVQQLEDLDGSQGAVLLQLEILRFLATALAVPRSCALRIPQMMDFYVHYHFLHFTRYYHKLPALANPATVASCQGHIKVLLALGSHTGGANLVRRRFQQLKILDFLVRELSLEHNLLVKQHLFTSRSNSCCSTPLSSCRSVVAPSSSRCLPASCDLSSSRAGCAQTPGTPVSRLSTVSLTPATGQGAAVSSPHTPQLILQGEQAPAAPEPLQQGPAATVAVSSSAAAEAVIVMHQQTGSRLRGSSSRPRSRATTPELSRTAGRRSPGIASHSRVVAKQRQRSAAATAAAAAIATASDVSPGTSVKQAVRMFEAAAAAASPPAGPCRGRRVQSAGRRLVVPSLLAAGGSAVGRNTQSTESRQGQAVQQQGLVSRPFEVPAPGAEDDVVSHRPGFRGVPRLTLAGRASSSTAVNTAVSEGGASVTDCALQNDVVGEGSSKEDRSRSSTPVESDSPSSKSSVRRTNSGESLDADPGSDLSANMCSKLSPEQQQPIEGVGKENTATDADSRRAVPRLVFSMPSNLQAPSAAAQISADVRAESESGESEYRPGFDLEEDFERMMLAEDSGGDGWDTNSTGSVYDDTDSSSLIAAGREDCSEAGDEQQQQQPSSTANAPGGACVSSPLSSIHEAASKAEVLPIRKPEELDDCELHDAELEEQLLVSDTGTEHPDFSSNKSGHRTPARQSLVPHLNLSSRIAISSPLQQQQLPSAEPDSRGSSISALTPNTRPQAPSLLATATPLYTTRTPKSAAAAATTPHSRLKDAQLPQQCMTGATAGAAVMQAAAPGYPSARSAVYSSHRQAGAMYADQELHVLCLELALHLLGTPLGLLDQLQLPQDPSDGCLQHKVLVLLDHMSDPENQTVVQLLAQRARSQQQTQQQSAAVDSEPCDGRSREGWFAPSPAQTGSAGLGTCTLRLLKLLCRGMLNSKQLQLGAMIQKGAFSEIYAATWSSSGEPVAVAVKAVECGSDNYSCFERVFNEVAILENLHGQHGIVPLLEYGVMSDSPDTSPVSQSQWGLVFPRYSGSLREWRLKRGKGLRQQDVELYLNIFLQVAIIVRGLHAANVVHYDIKGDNLLLDLTCNGVQHATGSSSSSSRARVPFEIVLADFGDALMFDDAGAFAERHRGTELFSSPEMLLLHAGQQHPQHFAHDRRKHRGVGQPHDVWSLGCTLYELLTGKTLFEEQGVGRITSYAGSVSCAVPAAPAAATSKAVGASNHQQTQSTSAGGSLTHGHGGVLSSEERAELLSHPGLIDLVEFMLVGDVTWRPGAAEVVYKTQQLLFTCSQGKNDKPGHK